MGSEDGGGIWTKWISVRWRRRVAAEAVRAAGDIQEVEGLGHGVGTSRHAPLHEEDDNERWQDKEEIKREEGCIQ